MSKYNEIIKVTIQNDEELEETLELDSIQAIEMCTQIFSQLCHTEKEFLMDKLADNW